MANEQAEQLIAKVKCVNTRAILRNCDDSISLLYCQGFIQPAQMRKMRDKLVKKILAQTPPTQQGE